MIFQQPSTDAVAYNRVTGGNASQIQGKLTANGKVYLANPNGVIITQGAEINVAGLFATTKDLERISENGNTNQFTRKAKKWSGAKRRSGGKKKVKLSMKEHYGTRFRGT